MLVRKRQRRRDNDGRAAKRDVRIPLTAGSGWLLPALAGLSLSLAFPPSPSNPFAFAYGPLWSYVGLVPLLLCLWSGTRVGARVGESGGMSCADGFRRGWLAGTVFGLLTLYWVAFTRGGGPAVVGGTLLLSVYLGLFAGAFACLQLAVVKRWGAIGWLAAPASWTACEYLMTLGELGFPWLVLGHSQAVYPALIQYAEFTGVYGISFWIVALNSLIFLGLVAPLRPAGRVVLGACAALLFAVPWIYGRIVTDRSIRSPAAVVKVGLVQNNLGLEKWQPGGLERSLRSLEALSKLAAVEEPELIVWPETAVPCRLSRRGDCRRRVQSIVDEVRIPVLTGAPGRGPQGEAQNSAYLFSGEGGSELQSYAKMHLVPFGERTPFRDRIPLLKEIDWTALTGDLAPAEFAPGTERTLFEHPKGPFAALICFESVFPDFVRQSVGEGARFLVNITNDSWFGHTAGPFQHAQLAVLRAVENRIGIARCATSGVSLFIDPFGRTSQATDIFTATYSVGSIPLVHGDGSGTFYARHGDLFAQMTLVVSILLLVGVVLRR